MNAEFKCLVTVTQAVTSQISVVGFITLLPHESCLQ